MSKSRELRAEVKTEVRKPGGEKPAGEIYEVLHQIEEVINNLGVSIDVLDDTLSPILKPDREEIAVGPDVETGSLLGIRLQKILSNLRLKNERIISLSNGTEL